jgi:hypothetical protein
VDTALVLQTLADSDVNLRMQTISTRVDRCAYCGRERGIDEELSADYDKDSLPPWISRGRVLNEIQLTSLHSGTW